MSLTSYLMSHYFQRSAELEAPVTRRLQVRRDLRVPMRDGVELLADHLSPVGGPAGLPTALIRTPYGRRSLLGQMVSRPLAERGFQVLIVSSRGTFGSGGVMDPFRQERQDGLDVIEWTLDQPWFGQAMVLSGLSYDGYTQWAVADALPPQVKAMAPVVTESAMTTQLRSRDGFSLELLIEWSSLIATQERPLATLRLNHQLRRTRRALSTLPLRDVDQVALGRRWPFIQDVLRYGAYDPHWDRLDHSATVADVQVPVSLVAGWYDVFLTGQLRDFQALQDAGRSARLTVGPWLHNDTVPNALTETLAFSLPLARGEQPPERAPVRLFVVGEEAWRDFDSWPPKGYEPQRFHLGPGGTLSTAPGQGTDRYRYDPGDPTPAVGGISITHGGKADNTELEARPDVLTYTTEALIEDIEVIGNASAAIWFRSGRPFADVFVRLCDVDEQGRSWNVCDGLTSIEGANELTEVKVELCPTAHRFKRGHLLRVQVSSGAFPRYARNPGTGEPIADAVELHVADQEIRFDVEHPSVIVLPVRSA